VSLRTLTERLWRVALADAMRRRLRGFRSSLAAREQCLWIWFAERQA
jgi:hypothetical protein